MFYDSNPWVFLIIDKNQHAFLVLKGVTPTFSNLGILLKIDMKNCPLLGKLLSVWRTIQYCPNQPNLPRQLKPHIAFSMFHILDTNLWALHWCRDVKAALILRKLSFIIAIWSLSDVSLSFSKRYTVLHFFLIWLKCICMNITVHIYSLNILKNWYFCYNGRNLKVLSYALVSLIGVWTKLA